MKDFICHIDNKLTPTTKKNGIAFLLKQRHDITLKNYELACQKFGKKSCCLKNYFLFNYYFFTKRGRKKYSTQRHTLVVIFKAINYYF